MNVLLFNSALLDMVDLSKYIPVSDWLSFPSLLEGEEDEETNKVYELLEYGLSDCISNVASTLVIITGMGILVALAKVGIRILKKYDRLKVVRKMLKNNVTASIAIRFTIEAYIQLGICLALASKERQSSPMGAYI